MNLVDRRPASPTFSYNDFCSCKTITFLEAIYYEEIFFRLSQFRYKDKNNS